MSKSEVYSWRLSPDLKRALEDAARAQGTSVAGLLDRLVRDWLAEHAPGVAGDEARVRKNALRFVGAVRGGDPRRASRARERVRQKLRNRRAR